MGLTLKVSVGSLLLERAFCEGGSTHLFSLSGSVLVLSLVKIAYLVDCSLGLQRRPGCVAAGG